MPPARFVVAVGSGKGGVGKSTITLNVALALAAKGLAVGILDADIYGPNIPIMMNLARKVHATHWDLAGSPSGRSKKFAPVDKLGLKVMSTGFIVAEDQPITWDANMVQMLVWQLLNRVEWGELDYLMVDLPPGTADVQQMFTGMLPLTGAVIVVTPQDVAHLDAKKAVQMFRSADVPIIGAVENMSGLTCPHCDTRVEVFPPVRQDRSIWEMGVAKLGDIPLDPSLENQGPAFQWIAEELIERLVKPPSKPLNRPV